jgi:hypothetical protein
VGGSSATRASSSAAMRTRFRTVERRRFEGLLPFCCPLARATRVTLAAYITQTWSRSNPHCGLYW